MKEFKDNSQLLNYSFRFYLYYPTFLYILLIILFIMTSIGAGHSIAIDFWVHDSIIHTASKYIQIIYLYEKFHQVRSIIWTNWPGGGRPSFSSRRVKIKNLYIRKKVHWNKSIKWKCIHNDIICFYHNSVMIKINDTNSFNF